MLYGYGIGSAQTETQGGIVLGSLMPCGRPGVPPLQSSPRGDEDGHAGVHTFVYANRALSGDELILHQRHRLRLNIRHALMQAFDRSQDGALVLRRRIEALPHDP